MKSYLLFLSLLVFSFCGAANIVVTNTNDSGVGSFRQAIVDANATATLDTIVFNITGTGIHEITLLTSLPSISRPLYIDGSSQFGYVANTSIFPAPINGQPVIVINYNGGLWQWAVNSSNVSMRGLVFVGHAGVNNFINVSNVNNFFFAGCYVGVDADGISRRFSNQGFGITLTNCSSSSIGSGLAEDRNIFLHLNHTSTNPSAITIRNGSSGIQVKGNYVGVAKNGTTISDLACHGGIRIMESSHHNAIGGQNEWEGNLVSGHVAVGITLGSTTFENTVQFNLCGTDYSGNLARPNNNGIGLYSCRKSYILDNLCSGNLGTSGQGIELDIDVDSCIILRNICGLNKAGDSPLPNSTHGITLSRECNYNQIGDGTFANRNIFSGNTIHGIRVGGQGPDNNNIFDYNYVGLSLDGSDCIGNGNSGIMINQVDTTFVWNNFVSCNGNNGIQLNLTNYTYLANNQVGVFRDGISPAANLGSGILVSGNYTYIGGSSNSDANLIANNGEHGIYISGHTATISNNVIHHNEEDGISVMNSQITMIENTIHSNGGLGIDLANNSVTRNDVGDADTNVPNEYLNFPVINQVNMGSLVINFNLDVPAGNYRMEVFGIPAGTGDPSHHGEGNIYLGSFNLSHPGGGSRNFIQSILGTFPIGIGDSISMTTTECLDGTCNTLGNTSEFSELRILSGPLPVELIIWDASMQAKDALLVWETEQEYNTDNFQVLYSPDGYKWENIATIAAAKNSNSNKHYSFTHPNRSLGVHYYQLKTMDLDGTYSLSSIKELWNQKVQEVAIYPNPSVGNLEVQTLENDENYQLIIFNSLGQSVYRRNLLAGEQNIKISLVDLPNGVYTLQIGNRSSKFVLTRN